jgi:hypothetical protein
MRGLTQTRASEVYDILARCCGAPEAMRIAFIHDQASPHLKEWRFSGDLGFGGKFWRNEGRLYVSCYPEDENPLRLDMIAKANQALAALAP